MRRVEHREIFLKPLLVPKSIRCSEVPIQQKLKSYQDQHQHEDKSEMEKECSGDAVVIQDNAKEEGALNDNITISGVDQLHESSPRTPCYEPIPPLLECPDAPIVRSLRRDLSRQTSLNETKLLMTTKLKRTASIFTFNKHFEFIRKIGSGSFSTVYEAQDKKGGSLFAVKMSKQQFCSREDRERFIREVQTVESLPEHPNVVKYFRCWQQDFYLYIQMELCENGNLRTLLDSMDCLLSENQVWNYIEQVASGLAHIHRNGVLHLDIKPENIFIDRQGVLKVGDFSLAIPESCWDWEEGDGGYVAPELLKEEEPGPEADMYSFGAMVYELARGQKLPRSLPERERILLVPLSRSTSLSSLVLSLLNSSPMKRPRASDVLSWRDSHPA